MRPESDSSCDTIIKKRLFLKYVAPFYNVVGVFDDRPKVVNMWHDINIPNVFRSSRPTNTILRESNE